MDSADQLHASDAAVPARYLQLRSLFHDRLLASLDQRLLTGYHVQPTRRIAATVVALVRTGYQRPVEGELWPVVFLNAVDITLALCVQIAGGRLASLGTMVNGPQRLRHRFWEDWWGWETALAGTHAKFFDLGAAEQEDAMLAWYTDKLEWLVHSGLLRRRA